MKKEIALLRKKIKDKRKENAERKRDIHKSGIYAKRKKISPPSLEEKKENKKIQRYRNSKF